jgi:hypothetical protein
VVTPALAWAEAAARARVIGALPRATVVAMAVAAPAATETSRRRVGREVCGNIKRKGDRYTDV